MSPEDEELRQEAEHDADEQADGKAGESRRGDVGEDELEREKELDELDEGAAQGDGREVRVGRVDGRVDHDGREGESAEGGVLG